MVKEKPTTQSEVKTETKTKAKKMIEIPVYDLTGKSNSMITVSDTIFGQKENDALVAQYMRVYLQNQRQGTVSTKTRGEVAGTTKKMYRQKGTGRARHGSGKEPIFVGGGVAFGPKPREFSKSLNKKQKKQALYIALSTKAKQKAVIALDKETLSIKPKTKQIADLLKTLKFEGKKVLFILPKLEKGGFVLSTRNIASASLIGATTLNPYTVFDNSAIIFVGDALKTLEDHLASEK